MGIADDRGRGGPHSQPIHDPHPVSWPLIGAAAALALLALALSAFAPMGFAQP
jgi:hypothetical protein